MDVSETIAANSEQINAEDFLSGQRIVTISSVEQGNTEQPVFIHLAEFEGRTYRPAKTMRRLMVAVWGPDSRVYIGRRMRLFNDPDVKWAGKAVGGIRINAMSDIDKPVTVQLMVTRGKREPFTVQPLQAVPAPEPAPDGWQADVAACDTVEDLTEFYEMASAAGWWSAEVAAACTARKAVLSGADS